MSTPRLPDFIIAGATRSGTSTLFAMLSRHPQVFMPGEKELQFFYRDKLYAQGLASYGAHFDGAGDNEILGEASPPYFEKGFRLSETGAVVFDEMEDPAIRIRRDLPDVKIVLTLRNPIKRAYSQFWKNVWQGREDAATFEEAIELELSGKRTPLNHPLCWLYRNHYQIHVEHWLSLFPREHVHIMILEEWSKGLHDGLHPLQTFLGLQTPLHHEGSVSKTNTGRVLIHPALRPLAALTSRFRFINRLISRPENYPPLQPETENRLQEVFAGDKVYLSKVLGRPLEVW